MGQFAHASASLEQIVELSPDADCLLLLAAAYGQLGRRQDAVSAVSAYNDIRLRRGEVPITITTTPDFFYSVIADRDRLYEGLRLAGVPESLEDGAINSRNRLTASVLRDLFFGHRLHGRSFATGEEHSASITEQGIATLSGDWGSITNGRVEVADDGVCYVWSGSGRFCGTVVRNPGGTRATENELIWIDPRGPFAFSQVE